ncbi:HEPN domain-containing protein [Rhodococcus sp. NPDC058521]|uniref:HEPN domain-containing protein n=1 Tax=Rhodococcus sp. NPDC058521 TaxID=3346536 RepID=UPI003654E1F7
MEIRTSSKPMSHPKRAALNQSGMVFMVSVWEAYIEDVAREIADHIALYAKTFDELPKRLQTIITDGMIVAKTPRWLPRDIAGDGWREVVRTNSRQKCSDLNTPNEKNVNTLIHDTTGLAGLSESWQWQGARQGGPAALLDETISIRGDIVHTAQKPPELNANWIKTYGGNITQLVNRTDSALFEYGATFGTMIDFKDSTGEAARQWLTEDDHPAS